MTNSLIPGTLFALMAIMLVGGLLIQQRGPWSTALARMVTAVLMAGAGFILYTFRDEGGMVLARLKTEATGVPLVAGQTVRVPQSIDGHFWVEASVNGQPVRFIVDSGASVTTMDRATATAIGLKARPSPVIVRTGNGAIRVSTGRVDALTLGPIRRTRFTVHVADTAELNLLGMNFLSTLERWSVEGRWLVMVG